MPGQVDYPALILTFPGLNTILCLDGLNAGSLHAEIFRFDRVFNHFAMPEFAYPGFAGDGDLVQPALAAFLPWTTMT